MLLSRGKFVTGYQYNAGSIDLADYDKYVKELARSGQRLLDFDPNSSLAGYTTAIEKPNKGPNAEKWWFYGNVSADYINARLKEHGARLTDIEWNRGNNFSAIMVASKGESWWWYYGKTAEELDRLARQHGARIIDVETYRVNVQKRFAAILLQN